MDLTTARADGTMWDLSFEDDIAELRRLVEKLTCLNTFEGKIWKNDQKMVMDEE